MTAQSNEHKHGTFVLLNKHLVPFQGKYRCYAFNKLGTAITEEIELKAPSEWSKQREADMRHKVTDWIFIGVFCFLLFKVYPSFLRRKQRLLL